MKSAIFGAGAMGTVLGAYISRAGIDITLVNRNKEHVDALNRKGAAVIGETVMTQKVRAVLPEEMDDGYDVIILMTKQAENEKNAEFLKSKLSDKGVVCTAQNGLPETGLAKMLGEHKVIGCTAVWGATLVEPGVVRLTSKIRGMSFQIGSLTDGNEEQIQRVKALLEKMCPVYIEENFIGARWSKLLLNTAFSGLSAVSGLTFGQIVKDRNSLEIAQRVIKEAIDVAKAADIRIMPLQGKDIVKLMDYKGVIKKAFAKMIIPIAISSHRSVRSGMLEDIQRGRKTDIEAINGVVCEFGNKYGCKTPFNDRIVSLVQKIETGENKVSRENLFLFKDLLL